jgi:putative flippase GtrA
MGKLRHEIWTFCKAQFSAQVATIADFGVSMLLAEVVGMWYVWASFSGAVTGGITNCIVNYRWVFDGTKELKKKYIAFKYLFVWTGSILLNTAGTFALTELSGQYFIFAKIVVAVGVALLWNYQLQRLFVYRDTHIVEKIKRKRKNKHKRKK